MQHMRPRRDDASGDAVTDRLPETPDPSGDKHPLAEAAWGTFVRARAGLGEALEYLGATNTDDLPRLRVALAGVAAACDSLKATANAYANVLGHVSRAPGSSRQ